jgi:hypothetical protein
MNAQSSGSSRFGTQQQFGSRAHNIAINRHRRKPAHALLQMGPGLQRQTNITSIVTALPQPKESSLIPVLFLKRFGLY